MENTEIIELMIKARVTMVRFEKYQLTHYNKEMHDKIFEAIKKLLIDVDTYLNGRNAPI